VQKQNDPRSSFRRMGVEHISRPTVDLLAPPAVCHVARVNR
jgi:hypothetical protein